MPTHRCPICGRPVDPQSAAAPFCSPRCRQIDLGRWLDGRYAVPAEREADEEPEGEPGASAPDK